MRDILTTLNQEAKTSGSMVITPDGIMVSAALAPGFEEDTMAAFAASLLLSLKRSLQAMHAKGDVKSCTLNSSNGKVMFFDMQNSYLVLVADSNTVLDGSAGPIQSAIHKITNRRIA
jgi:predicted regulator of Ras-like GTPase activity (Roadblock/LC7/MglB family)